MKKKYFFIGILIISLILSWCYRYSTLNSFYQTLSERTRVVFLAEEYVDFGTDWLTKDVTAEGYSIRVDNFDIVDYEEYIMSLQSDYQEPYVKPDKLALVYITLRNENSSEDGVMLTDLKLHGIDNYVGIDWDVLIMANSVLAGHYGINIAPGKEYQLILPYDLEEKYFGKDTWERIDSYTFYLHITSYPVEKDIKVN